AACCGGCCCCSRGVDDCITKYPSAASAAKEAKPQRKPFTVGLIEEVLGAGCWVLGAGCWVLGAGCWVPGAVDGVDGCASRRWRTSAVSRSSLARSTTASS